jgi:hypothetical protein
LEIFFIFFGDFFEMLRRLPLFWLKGGGEP